MRIAILNRGEAAVRFIRAVREYNIERGTNIRAIAFYTQPDDGTPFVRLADEAICLGPALVPGTDGAMVSAYCHHERVIKALRKSRCAAVWPGWGFIAEDSNFVEKLEEAGITFLGPSADAMRKLGDKIASKKLAEAYKVPVSPWTIIDGQSDEELIAEAEQIGFPLMVKASAGGGGRGIRKVDSSDQLLESIVSARDEVAKVFSAGGLFMEACITKARHIEVQFVVDHDGVATAVGIRDCSIQRRNQKVIEEAPSPVVDKKGENLICDATVRLAEGAGYRGVGTAEYLYQPAGKKFYFLEVNSRLQVEHTITELTTGADLVKAQIDIARGLAWENPGKGCHGYAIEVRLNAENPAKGFQPSPGLIRVFQPPAGPGLRVDSGVAEGMTIAPDFDSMIAKVMAYGRTREEAIARLTRALKEFPVVVEDGATNKAFLLQLLSQKAYLDCSADTQWLDRAMEEGVFSGDRHQFEAALAATTIVYRQEMMTDTHRFLAEVQNGIPQNVRLPEGNVISLRVGSNNVDLAIHNTGRNRYQVGPEGSLHDVRFEPRSANAATLYIGETRYEVLFSHGSTGIYVEIDGAGHIIEELSGGVVRAPSPAMVVSVSVEEGQTVEVGDRLATLEAMKMEMPLFATEAGTVKSVFCRANQQVSAGQALLELDTEGAADAVEEEVVALKKTPAERPLDMLRVDGGLDVRLLDSLKPRKAEAAVQDLIGIMEPILLGYDVPDYEVELLRSFFRADEAIQSLKNPERLVPIARTLKAFADTESLFDRNFLPLDNETAAVSAEIAFYDYCRNLHDGEDGAADEVKEALLRALQWYGVNSLEPSDELRLAVWRLAVGHAHPELRHRLCSSVLRTLIGLHVAGARFHKIAKLNDTPDRVAQLARPQFPFVADNARQANYELFQRTRFVQRQQQVMSGLDDTLDALEGESHGSEAYEQGFEKILKTQHSLMPLLAPHTNPAHSRAPIAAEALLRRAYEQWDDSAFAVNTDGDVLVARLEVTGSESIRAVSAAFANPDQLDEALAAVGRALEEEGADHAAEVILHVPVSDASAFDERLADAVKSCSLHTVGTDRLTVTWPASSSGTTLKHRTFRDTGKGTLEETLLLRDIHPEAARRIELWRLSEFDVTRLESHELIYAFRGQAHENPDDERIFIFAEVRNVPGQVAGEEDLHLLEFEHAYFEALRILREQQALKPKRHRYHWNRLAFILRPDFELSRRKLLDISHPLEAPTRGLGLQKVIIRARIHQDNEVQDTDIIVSNPSRNKLQIELREPHAHPIRALKSDELRTVRARRMGMIYPYELTRMLEGKIDASAPTHPDMARGHFVEFDLNPTRPDELISVEGRPPGENKASVVVGLITNFTAKHPDGMERVLIASDPTLSMGALSEPECRRVIGALDLAEERGVPVEWIPVSSGAKIAMDSGTENLDWTARVLRRIVEFTQIGGEINILVNGVNVGAQSYWNAEATMLQHTRGILIMTPGASMVLTGKKALEYSGSVAAEDERGIGGFERIMGPNGQAQYFASDLGEAYRILFEHYRFTYRRTRDVGVSLHATTDPPDRSILEAPYAATNGETFQTVGEIFDDATNPGRKKPFAIREVMRAAIDQDGGHLERFRTMSDAETGVIWDAHVGGHAVCVIGFESRPIPRRGRIPMDGPDTWSGGTLFPQSSKKVARAINAASGNRPVVVLANLSGFDGSPESMRKLQLEYGAEIGRAIVNFEGPVVFVVVGRYHGGAYVVFSKGLNRNLTAMALEGTYASVIGGAPAAAVVFPRDVRARTNKDPRVIAANEALASASPAVRPRLREQLNELLNEVMLEKQGEVATEFDSIHTVHRATEVGSLDAVIQPDELRPAIIDVLNKAREKAESTAEPGVRAVS